MSPRLTLPSQSGGNFSTVPLLLDEEELDDVSPLLPELLLELDELDDVRPRPASGEPSSAGSPALGTSSNDTRNVQPAAHAPTTVASTSDLIPWCSGNTSR